VTGIVAQFLERTAQNPDRDAIIWQGERWTYETLAERARRYGSSLSGEGIVLVFLPQGPEAIAVYFGAMGVGLVPSFMPLPSPKQDPDRYWRSHVALLELIEPAVILTNAAGREAMRACAIRGPILTLGDLNGGSRPMAAGRDTEIALLQHTSGTTALKKGVALTHRAVLR
jgi:acyl-CoA synthetase (AMP-forming)/AMP-acid ligase II